MVIDTFTKMMNNTIATYDQSIQNAIGISVIMIMLLFTFTVITNTNKYISIPILLSEIIMKIWNVNSIECNSISTLTLTADQIFNELIIYYALFLMMMYAIYYRNYIAFIWVIMQPTIELLKGFSCGIAIALMNKQDFNLKHYHNENHQFYYTF